MYQARPGGYNEFSWHLACGGIPAGAYRLNFGLAKRRLVAPKQRSLSARMAEIVVFNFAGDEWIGG
jgi:hypothetical protein